MLAKRRADKSSMIVVLAILLLLLLFAIILAFTPRQATAPQKPMHERSAVQSSDRG